MHRFIYYPEAFKATTCCLIRWAGINMEPGAICQHLCCTWSGKQSDLIAIFRTKITITSGRMMKKTGVQNYHITSGYGILLPAVYFTIELIYLFTFPDSQTRTNDRLCITQKRRVHRISNTCVWRTNFDAGFMLFSLLFYPPFLDRHGLSAGLGETPEETPSQGGL